MFKTDLTISSKSLKNLFTNCPNLNLDSLFNINSLNPSANFSSTSLSDNDKALFNFLYSL